MNQREKDALDKWITGNYGEDQFKNERRSTREVDDNGLDTEEYEEWLDTLNEDDPREDR